VNLVLVDVPADLIVPFNLFQFPLSQPYVMNRLQTSGELQDKTSFIDPSTGVDLLKGCSPDYLLL